MADTQNNRDPFVAQESNPTDDTQIFRRALDELFPGRNIDTLETEELRSVLHLAQRMKAQLGVDKRSES